MGQALQLDFRAPGKLPAPPIDPALWRELCVARNDIEAGAIPRESIEPIRERLRARKGELDLALAPAAETRIIAILATMGQMIARRPQSEAEAAAAFAVEVEDMKGLPEWALERAVAHFRRGVVGDGRFRPIPGEVRKLAVEMIQDAARERREIAETLAARVVAPAEPVDPERRRELAQRICALARGFAA